MISVDEARARILALFTPTAAEIVPLHEAWSRVTAAPVVARLDQPPSDMSAMDGYALRSADIGPRRLVAAAPAGHPFDGQVGPGEAVRLFTGSVVPDGADCVVIQENAKREAVEDEARGEAAHVTPTDRPRPGDHIRRRGQDFSIGATLMAAGVRLDARGVGLAAAGNHAWLAVRRRPVVAILATGDEIALPGDPIAPGGIVSSNAHALAALVRARGGAPMILPIARDSEHAIAEAVAAAKSADLLVTIGGASVGDHDKIRPGLARQGFSLDFWRVAMRPGKPLLCGRMGGAGVIGLPGNPVSALVCAILFVIPALDLLQGLAGDPPPVALARLARPLPGNDERADFIRATLGPDHDGIPEATPFSRQDSAMLQLFCQAHALILRAPGAPALAAGAPVSVIRLDRLGI